ncbi:cytochrome c biogenesis heme-transporting ATPase CcmA [Uliginosibacterium sediminicola]|uniref:Cytochrome c biogenesis heme-transporting ATPase CcmA n=1 Tax=Uliginosibacterium sediminicola TaxID=2024550 RepID=A0ABU9Z1J6_9RHOO
MLEAHDLACLRGDRLLFRRLGFSLAAGELLRVAGPNGSGKTSLLRILSGLASAETGSLHWRGQDTRREREAWHAELIYLGHAPALSELLTPLENLRFAAAAEGIEASTAACRDALQRIGLERQLGLPCRVLSQGQRRRVALARLLLPRSRAVWILDEPFAALDVTAVSALSERIAAHAAAGGMAIFTTHQEAGLAARTLDLQDFAA